MHLTFVVVSLCIFWHYSVTVCSTFFYKAKSMKNFAHHWGTGIRRLMRGMATLPQGN